jgi:hypothetical protein
LYKISMCNASSSSWCEIVGKEYSSILPIEPMFCLWFGELLLMITLRIICYLAAVVMIWLGPSQGYESHWKEYVFTIVLMPRIPVVMMNIIHEYRDRCCCFYRSA